MALISIRTIKQVWSSTLSKHVLETKVIKNGLRASSSRKVWARPDTEKFILLKEIPTWHGNTQTFLSEKNKGFIDLFTNNAHKNLYLPTVSINKLKVYEDITSLKAIIDPAISSVKIIDVPVTGQPEKKEAVRMILIRRRKMRKHKLRKFRKRMRFVLAKIKMRRELRKEQAFRTELLSQVEAAENFDPKLHVEKVLNTIRYQPRMETVEEIKARYREIMKMNKYKTMFIRPKFDDD